MMSNLWMVDPDKSVIVVSVKRTVGKYVADIHYELTDDENRVIPSVVTSTWEGVILPPHPPD